MNIKEVTTNLKLKKAQLVQVEGTSCMTDYEFVWKSQRISELKEKIQELKLYLAPIKSQPRISISEHNY